MEKVCFEYGEKERRVIDGDSGEADENGGTGMTKEVRL